MLTDRAIKNAEPKAKQYVLWDKDGLMLVVSPRGGKWWRIKYRHEGKEHRPSAGVYPEVGLKLAREITGWFWERYRKEGVPPKISEYWTGGGCEEASDTFESLAMEWHAKQGYNEKYAEDILTLFKKYIFPDLGKQGLTSIKANAILKVVQKVEEQGKIETAHKVRIKISQVFRYAIAKGKAELDPTPSLKGAIVAKKKKHLPALVNPQDFRRVLLSIDGYKPGIVKLALKFMALVFVRSEPLRFAEKSQIDRKDKLWRIPGSIMKMDHDHLVPLATQTLELLDEAELYSGGSPFIFPSLRSPNRPLSENTLNVALYTMGFKGEHVAHGFRSSATSILSELGWKKEVIDRQLAHQEKGSVWDAYHRAEYLEERRRMMQAWADYLDSLRQ